MTRFTDSRTLMEIHRQLMTDIESCAGMLTGDHDDDPDAVNDMEAMCEQLGQIEEVAFLKTAVDCDCFYQ